MKPIKDVFEASHSRFVLFLALVTAFYSVALGSAVADESVASLASPQDAFTYSLAGVSLIDGVPYASLVEKPTKKTLLISPGNSVEGWILVSVTGENGATGPSAIIQRNDVSLQLALDAFSSDVVPHALSLSTTDQESVPVSSLEFVVPPLPPSGGTLPLIFHPIDPQKTTLSLSTDQMQAINQLRRDFLKAVSGTSSNTTTSAAGKTASSNSPATNTSSAASTVNDSVASTHSGSQPALTPPSSTDQQLKTWQAAQDQSDQQLRATLGWQAYNVYEQSLAN